MKEVVIYNSKKKTIGLMVFVITVFFALILYSIDSYNTRSMDNTSHMTANMITGGIGLLCLFTIFSLYRQLQDKTASLILDDEGLTFDTKNNVKVKWEQVSSITDFNNHGYRTLFIHVSDPDSFISHIKNPKSQKSMRLLLSLHDAPIAIPLQLLDISPNRLKSELHRFLFHHVQQENG